jgi:hypothetical protein
MPAAQKRHEISQQPTMAAGEQGDEYGLPVGLTVRRGRWCESGHRRNSTPEASFSSGNTCRGNILNPDR